MQPCMKMAVAEICCIYADETGSLTHSNFSILNLLLEHFSCYGLKKKKILGKQSCPLQSRYRDKSQVIVKLKTLKRCISSDLFNIRLRSKGSPLSQICQSCCIHCTTEVEHCKLFCCAFCFLLKCQFSSAEQLVT